MDIMHNKYTFHVTGTHCASCKILLEDILGEEGLVNSVKVNLKNQTVEVEIKNEGDNKTQEEIIALLNPKIISHKYFLSIERNNSSKAGYCSLPIYLLYNKGL